MIDTLPVNKNHCRHTAFSLYLQAPRTAIQETHFFFARNIHPFSQNYVKKHNKGILYLNVYVKLMVLIWFYSNTESDQANVPSHAVLTFCHRHNQKQENP